ncbi:MAG: ABC transporter permease [Ruminiclostridium sp.]|nr:ABC transporter permease [Ruminiclostridium sp.]
MKLYPKLALSSFRKNGRFYLPYILTCAGMVLMCYIVRYLGGLPQLDTVRGGAMVKSCLGMGVSIIGLFSVIFLFYTNAFLMRRRKMEFGLYNILGLSKGNLSMLLLVETVMIAVLSLVLGLAGGIALSKLTELLLLRLVGGESSYGLLVDLNALGSCLALFGVIFVLLYLNSLWQLRRANAIALLHSETVGEKPPKANYLLALGGLVLLGGAYYVSVTIEDPISALGLFFFAVGVVIVATYLLFISGSVTLCRALQKNKRYYYKKQHFISVSSMAYRMKRNGAGLASVCILSTMVLVMMAGSCCLYFGTEGSLMNRYPRELNLRLDFETTADLSLREGVRGKIDGFLDQQGVTPENPRELIMANCSGILEGNKVVTNSEGYGVVSLTTADLRTIYFIPLEEYNRGLGLQETLEPGQALVYGLSAQEYPSLDIGGAVTLELVKTVPEMLTVGGSTVDVAPSLFLVVPELGPVLDQLNTLPEFSQRFTIHPIWEYAFDAGLEPEAELTLAQDLKDLLWDGAEAGQYSVGVDSREANRGDFVATYGAVLFLGVLLTVVFLFATVLILYYKQITEGYEDQSRFGIMQKVGMSKGDIRKSVNSQLLTVFFLPLAVALTHLAFSFPMVRRILMLFNLWDLSLLLTITGITVVVFALLYFLVYTITARMYYRIVADGR